MGDEFSYAHAACLAAQLPRGSRCRVADDPHERWDDGDWMLWRIHHSVDVLRWAFVKYDGEPIPQHLPYPGREADERSARARFEANRNAVDDAFGMVIDDGN